MFKDFYGNYSINYGMIITVIYKMESKVVLRHYFQKKYIFLKMPNGDELSLMARRIICVAIKGNWKLIG